MRLTFPTQDTYTAEQQRVVDIALSSARGRVAGPLPALLTSPPVAEHMHLLGAYLGYKSTVPRDAVELAILTTAHERGYDYVWKVHLPRAHENGVAPEVVAAIGENRDPEFPSDTQLLAFEVARALSRSSALDDQLYDRAQAAFKERGLVELVALVGFYHAVGMVLNVFGSINVPHKLSDDH